MPGSSDKVTKGFQTWINLGSQHKFCQPRYQELKADKIPCFIDEKTGLKAKVISGEVNGVKGPIENQTPAWFIDFEI